MRRPTLLELVVCCCIVVLLTALLVPARQPQVPKPLSDNILQGVGVVAAVMAALGITVLLAQCGGRWAFSHFHFHANEGSVSEGQKGEAIDASQSPWPNPWPKDRVATLHCAGLELTEHMCERLRQIREQQLADHLAGRPEMVCAIFYDQAVVCLRAGGGHAVYLGLDGRLHYENYGEGVACEVQTDSRNVAGAIVRFAGNIGMPELIDLLPIKPEEAFVCGVCKGSRWMPPEIMSSDDRQPIVCLRCFGLGWTLAEPAVTNR